MKKAIALLSGGLDSILAVKLIIEQGFEVTALNFTSQFCTCNAGAKDKSACKGAAQRVAEEFGIEIKVLTKGPDYIEVVRNPKYGYGKGINPCVDCRIYMLRRAKKYMEEAGAEFILTGEVLGQRPMSQRRDTFKIIEKESGLEGLILRPLSAKHLPPTIPELKGIVDREKLLNMEGRTRAPQMELADEFNISDYPCPSGGCLLADKIFAKKVRDLLDYKKDVTGLDLLLLKIGKHFRYEGAKIIVSKNETENAKLKNFIQTNDALLEPTDFPGPTAIVSGSSLNGAIEAAGRVMLRYSPKSGGRGTVKITKNGAEELLEINQPMDDKTVEKIRVC